MFLLSDGYIANGSEPWKIPDIESLPDLRVQFATEHNHTADDGTTAFWPYLRDPETLARPWAVPGTKGLEHRIGGIEKADGVGNISYDADNHDRMVRLRQAKIDGISVPDLEVDDPTGDARVLVLGWGSTYGPINAGCEIARRVYGTPTRPGADVCVLSVYPKDAEFLQYLTAFAPWQTAPEPLVREGGTVVVALDGGEGLGSHWLFGPGMRLDGGRAPRVKGRDVVFFAPGIDRGALPPAARDEAILFKTWEETRAWLTAKHGASARASVFPCGTIQLGAGKG